MATDTSDHRTLDHPELEAAAITSLCSSSVAGCQALVAADGGIALVIHNLSASGTLAIYAMHTVRAFGSTADCAGHHRRLRQFYVTAPPHVPPSCFLLHR